MTGYPLSGLNTTMNERTRLLGICIITAAAALSALTAVALAYSYVSVSPSSQTVSQGETFTVAIFVEPDRDIAGVQFSLKFNGSLISVKTVSEGELLKKSGLNTFFNEGKINNEDGIISDVYGCILGKGNVSESGYFALINATALSPGTSYIELKNVKISDPEGNYVPVIVENGTVMIIQSPTPTISPTISPTASPPSISPSPSPSTSQPASPSPHPRSIIPFEDLLALAGSILAYLLSMRRKS